MQTGRWPHCYFRGILDTSEGPDHFIVERPVRGPTVPPAREESFDMRQFGSLLRSTPSRIGRRLALIVAIAAASLPSAGA
jgi:hypothetical protein